MVFITVIEAHTSNLTLRDVLTYFHSGYSTRGLAGLCTAPIKIETSDVITSIGQPLKNTSAVVIADKPGFHLLPRGAVGLLCFNGDQLVSPGKKRLWVDDMLKAVLILQRDYLPQRTASRTHSLADCTELVILVEFFQMGIFCSLASMRLLLSLIKLCCHRSSWRIL